MTHATRKTTLELHLAGLLSDLEALELLEQVQTHGAFRDDGSYIGYDYAAQLWVDTA